MGKERRRSRRVAVDVPARLTVGGETLDGRLHDICRDAALVLAGRSWPLETPMGLEAELPGVPGRVRASGRVVRLAAAEQGQHGMALLFDELAPESALRIELYISDREAAKA
jgi:hypothetical protein